MPELNSGVQVAFGPPCNGCMLEGLDWGSPDTAAAGRGLITLVGLTPVLRRHSAGTDWSLYIGRGLTGVSLG